MASPPPHPYHHIYFHVILKGVALTWKAFGGRAGRRGNSMTRMDPENQFLSFKKKNLNNWSEFPFSILFWIRGSVIHASRMLP